MITTLRITSILAAALAVFVLAAVLGFVPFLNRGATEREAAEKVLNSPGAIERFNKQHGGKAAADQDKTPPLIQQAQLLAGILNPPPPPPRANPPGGRGPEREILIDDPTRQFDLVGTSYCASNPADSFAYIRLPGNEYRWVRKGSQVQHFVVTEVRSGSIIYSDGRTESTLPIEPTPSTASLLEPGGARAAVIAPDVSRPTMRARTPSLGRPTAVRRPLTTPRPSAPDVDAAEKERMTELVNKLRELQRRSGGSGADAEAAARERAALTEKLMSEFKSSRVSDEEVERLEDLGEEFSGTQSKSLLERRREFRRRMGGPAGRDANDGAP